MTITYGFYVSFALNASAITSICLFGVNIFVKDSFIASYTDFLID